MVEANDAGSAFDSDDEEMMSPEQAKEELFKAVKENNVEYARELLEKGATSANVEKDGWNPLLWASCNGFEEMVRLLIKH